MRVVVRAMVVCLREDHGENTSAGAGEGVGDIVILRNKRFRGDWHFEVFVLVVDVQAVQGRVADGVRYRDE